MFVELREVLATHHAVAQKIGQLSRTQKDHAALFEIVIQDIHNLDKRLTQQIRQLKGSQRAGKRKLGSTFPE